MPRGRALAFCSEILLMLKPVVTQAVVDSESFNLRRASRWPTWLILNFELTLSSNLCVKPSLASVALVCQSTTNSVPTVWKDEALWKKKKKNLPN